MVILPRHIERLTVSFEAERFAAFAGNGADAVRLIDPLDPVDGRHFEPGLAGIGIELDWAGADDGMLGDILGGFEVALQSGVLDKLDIAEMRKALAADRSVDPSMPTSRSTPVRS